ncbi:tetraspanin [Colletotrichum truncatum]|uniref:Tetraspanin n=1 Tax=Colletotrichum truncatum TaxID=5467 RepID=A0ACC3Z0T8_COLTU|nr:tetraspanin [Colletotrichum truncatum]KAF6800522.1 tetraspanin [Colletotrichum truncatum]
MANKVLLAYVAADMVFLITGAILIGYSLINQNAINEAPKEGVDAAIKLLTKQFPLTAGIVNAVFIFVTFLFTIPGIITPTRGWLKVSGYLVTFCGLFSLVLGTYLWVLTLTTKADFGKLWVTADPNVQELMQTAFKCCGYFNSTSPAFITDIQCPSPAAAALQRGCAAPITSFANVFVDNIFTAVFGMVGIDALLVVCTAMLVKDRKERERYRHIDEKSGYRGF